MGSEITRRGFVKLMGAGAAAVGLAACQRPDERILPYVDQPPELTPGVAQHYATSMELGGYACGLVVESHVGRPTKVEGNPEHPASMGAASVYHQGSVLQLYDPDRATRLLHRGRPATEAELARVLGAARADGGAGLAFLMEPTGSPLVGAMMERVRARHPAARFHFHAPLHSDAPREGAGAVLGHDAEPVYDFGAADVVVALDADFLAQGPFSLRYARHFSDHHAPRGPRGKMSRLYLAEPTLTPTGTVADHRLPLRAAEVPDVAAALVSAVSGGEGAAPDGPFGDFVRAAAADLRSAAGRSVVIAGDRQPAEVHALVLLINAALGNVGKTVRYRAPVLLSAREPAGDLAALTAAMRAGRVDTLVILGGNPVFIAPPDLGFAEALDRVPRSVHLGLYPDETARACEWSVPAAHYLETWGDARAYDGTVSLVQPLIAPMYGGKTAAELLALAAGAPASAHELLTGYWRTRMIGGFDAQWEAALQRGFIASTETAPVPALPRAGAAAELTAAIARSRAARTAGVEIVFQQDPKVYDGRLANVPQLQEIPEPITKLTWDNAAVMSPATAARLGVETGRMVRLENGGHSLDVPAYVLPGHADGSISLALGYGGAWGEAARLGFDAYRLRTAATPYVAPGAKVEPSPDGGSYPLAATQTHFELHDRPIVLSATLAEYRANPDFTSEQRGRTLSLYDPYQEEYRTGPQWTMSIDLTRCTGCSACVMACVAENNVPVVGKDGVLKGREMHWLRLDRYSTDEGAAMQPMLCQHCEHAPCEYVCPVNATVHGSEGLNQMVYNRCVGTRFCSNNCPYKVRRFNWFNYTADLSDSERLAMNPDVTVRARGVMEKCTFCVQRIREAEIRAGREERAIRPAEVRTACQQTCPTQAIVFGSYTDPDETLKERLGDPRRFVVLHELGTEPRVRYMAKISNPGEDSGFGIRDSGGTQGGLRG